MTDIVDKPAPAALPSRPAAAPAVAAAASVPVTPPVVPPPHVRQEPKRPGKFRRFVRSVFSHLMFAALVTAGAFGYVYQDMILGRVATTVCGNDVLGPYAPGGSKSAAASPPASSPSVSAAPAAKVAPPPAETRPVAAATAPAPSPAPAPVAKPEIVAAAPLPAEAKPATAPATDTASKPVEPPKPSVPAIAVEPPKSEPAPTKALVIPPPKSAPPAVTPPSTAVSEPAPSPPASTPAKPVATGPEKPAAAPAAPDQLTSAWRAAREAFNAGKPEAIDAYKSLLRSYPDVPDIAGELGNIYYAAGKWREASESYYEAAQRFLKSPQPGYAACLLDVLRNLRSPDAERLAPQITRPCPAARSGQQGQGASQDSGPSSSNPPRG